MKKILPTTLLGVAGLTAFGLIAMATPVVSATPTRPPSATTTRRRWSWSPTTTMTTPTTTTTTTRTRNSPSYTDQSRDTNDNTNSRFTEVSRDRDKSRGDKTRDWTRDGRRQEARLVGQQHQRPQPQRHPR